MKLPRTFAELSARFPVAETVVQVADHPWRLAAIRDHDVLVNEIKEDADLDDFPYGLVLWASAIGLAEHIARQPSLVAGRRVLEIGAGLGLSGMVAAASGATSVLQTDYQETTLAVCAHNAALNDIPEGKLTRALADWRGFPEGLGQPFDVVIASDVLYERTLHSALLALLPPLVAPGGVLCIADPQRPQAADFMERFQQEQGDLWRVETTMRPVRFEGAERQIRIYSATRLDSLGED